MAIDLISNSEMMGSVSGDINPSSSSSSSVSALLMEDLSKKVRKPYTITKSRESWTDQEHDKFLEALQLFDRDWKKIEAFIGSKTVIQIRSHAQKYFLKVQKNGTGEHVPPPRPKRKSAQPYPHKAAKTVFATQQMPPIINQSDPSCAVLVQHFGPGPGSAVSINPAWVHHVSLQGNTTFLKRKGLTTLGVVSPKTQVDHSKDSSSMPQNQLASMHGNNDIVLRAMPDFTEVYSFLGGVFDPSTDGHLEKMQEMAPIDRETVLLLMKNLSINLSSADFEEHKLFLSVYDMDLEDTLRGVGNDVKTQTDIPVASVAYQLLQENENDKEIKQ